MTARIELLCSMYESAQEFLLAGERTGAILTIGTFEDHNLPAASMSSFALSLEIFLKTIISLKATPAKTHNIKKLVDHYNLEFNDNIFDFIIKSARLELKILDKNSGAKIFDQFGEKHFSYVEKEDDFFNAFENYRYRFEKSTTQPIRKMRSAAIFAMNVTREKIPLISSRFDRAWGAWLPETDPTNLLFKFWSPTP